MTFKILKFLLAPFRFFTSFLILFYDRVCTPRSLSRDPESQKLVNEQTLGLVLYHFQACPFCVKVRRQIKRLGLQIETRDILRETQFEQELIKGGGERQVPCLRIPLKEGGFQWLYESSDINTYLSERFQGPN